jgi:hypothetical protein
MMQTGTIGGFILSILFLAMLVVGFTTYFGGIPSAYSVNASTYNNSSLVSSSDEIYAQAVEMKNKTENIQITPIAEINYLYATMNGAYSAIKLSYNAMDFFAKFMIGDLAGAIGLPIGWALGFAYAATAIIIVLLVLGAIYKWELVRW